MAYNRQPQTVLAGTALRQNPAPTVIQPSGIIPVTLDAEIASTSSLGVVQIGSGLSITPLGVLSATNSGTDIINVTLTSVDYSAQLTDYYIGAIKKDIYITLPLGIVGKVYIIKNQATGNIRVEGTAGQKLDTSLSKTLGAEAAIICVFDGARWNII